MDRGEWMTHYQGVRNEVGTTRYTEALLRPNLYGEVSPRTRKKQRSQKAKAKGPRKTPDTPKQIQVSPHKKPMEDMIDELLITSKNTHTPTKTQEGTDTKETTEPKEPKDTKETTEPKTTEPTKTTETKETTEPTKSTGKTIKVKASTEPDSKKAGMQFII